LVCTVFGAYFLIFALFSVHQNEVKEMSRYYSKQSITENGELVKDRKIKLYNPFKVGRGYNFKYKSLNVRSYLEIPLPDCFTDSEVGKIYRLTRSIYSSSNMLAYRSGGKIYPLSKEDIRKIVVLHRNNFNPFWHKVLNNTVIKPVVLDGSEYYCFNPIYFNSTLYLPLYLFIAFQDELINHLPKWVVSKYLDMQEGKETEVKQNS
jgi:hypothetical protein